VIVHIRGTNTRNKGAQLMLQAIHSRLGAHFDLSVVPGTTDSAVRRRLGLRQTLCHPVLPRATAAASRAVPSSVRARRAVTSDRDVDGVLDASGFHYTDQLPTAFPRSEARAGRAWARRGVPKILMPQAFGPFEKAATRRWSREALEQASLVFVRDRVSENYVNHLHIGTTTVRCPDFTIDLHPDPIDPIADQPFLALVPNTKLFTHSDLTRDRYVAVLAGFADAGRANGLAPVIVVHEKSDHAVAADLSERTGAPVFSDEDPLVLKAALGQAEAAVASRFHAVVGVADRLITDQSDPKAALTELLSDTAGNARQRERLPVLIEQVDTMWEQTIDTLMRR
jgi:colanic acid/amylovoran biosynthesis protein